MLNETFLADFMLASTGEADLPRMRALLDVVSSVKRPSDSSVTNVMDRNSVHIWRQLWLEGSSISETKFKNLPNKLVFRAANNHGFFVNCRSSYAWSEATSLNPKAGASAYRNHEIVSLTGGSNHWAEDFLDSHVGMPGLSMSVEAFKAPLNRYFRPKLKHFLERLPQHVIIVI